MAECLSVPAPGGAAVDTVGVAVGTGAAVNIGAAVDTAEEAGVADVAAMAAVVTDAAPMDTATPEAAGAVSMVEAAASTVVVGSMVVVDTAEAVSTVVVDMAGVDMAVDTGKGLKTRKCFNGWQHCAASRFSLVLPYPAYIPITRSIALRHTAQNVRCRVNMMQSTSER